MNQQHSANGKNPTTSSTQAGAAHTSLCECEERLPNGANFCPSCGKRAPGALLPTKPRFCSVCGNVAADPAHRYCIDDGGILLAHGEGVPVVTRLASLRAAEQAEEQKLLICANPGANILSSRPSLAMVELQLMGTIRARHLLQEMSAPEIMEHCLTPSPLWMHTAFLRHVTDSPPHLASRYLNPHDVLWRTAMKLFIYTVVVEKSFVLIDRFFTKPILDYLEQTNRSTEDTPSLKQFQFKFSDWDREQYKHQMNMWHQIWLDDRRFEQQLGLTPNNSNDLLLRTLQSAPPPPESPYDNLSYLVGSYHTEDEISLWEQRRVMLSGYTTGGGVFVDSTLVSPARKGTSHA